MGGGGGVSLWLWLKVDFAFLWGLRREAFLDAVSHSKDQLFCELGWDL